MLYWLYFMTPFLSCVEQPQHDWQLPSKNVLTFLPVIMGLQLPK